MINLTFFQKLARFLSLGFVLSLFVVWANPALAEITGSVEVEQTGPGEVVVSWQTSTRGSSQVRYSSNRGLGEQITSEYASNSTIHQVKVIGLLTGESYSFVAISTGEDGKIAASAPVSHTIRPMPARTSDSTSNTTLTPEHERRSLGDYFGLPGQFRQELAQQVHEARDYTMAQKASLLFIFLSAFLMLLLLLLEEGTFFVIVTAILFVNSWRLNRFRRHKTSFTIYNGETNKPVPGAEVLVVSRYHNTVLKRYTADAMGRVFFDWPLNEPVTIRITQNGFQGLNQTFDQEVNDIMLTPLADVVDSNRLASMRFKFYARHSLQVLNLTSLSIGSFFLLVAVLIDRNPLTLIMLAAAAYLWLVYLLRKPRRYHMGQVLDTINQKPVAGAHVTLYRGGHHEMRLSDKNGFVPIAYPLPDFISLSKKGYVSTLRQTVPATAISAEPLLLSLRPQE